MRNSQYWAFALTALTMALCACSGAKKFGEPEQEVICKPGETGQAVKCADGSQGFLKCNAEGTAFSDTTCMSGQQPVTGCGSDGAQCALGLSLPCGCTDGRTGASACKADCSGFDVCVCTGPLPGAGGSAGTSGQGGASGTSGQGGASGQGGTSGSNGTGGSAGTSTGGASGQGGSGGTSGLGGSSGIGGTDGGTSKCGTSEAICAVGQTFDDCHCLVNSVVVSGTQKCNADCTGRTACECSTADAGTGGSAGSGGFSGAGGSSTGGSSGSDAGLGNLCSQSGRVCDSNQDNLCHCIVNDTVKQGLQFCNSDCDGWTSCSCGTGGQGGSGGSGGASGQGGQGGSGGTGGSGQLARVDCEIIHPDNTQYKFDFSSGQFSSNQHVYRVFVSDEGVDDGNGNAIYANPDHVEWGEDAKLGVQQLGSSVKISFQSGLNNRLKLNATRDPEGNDLASAAYWKESACSRDLDHPVEMRWECKLTVNGQTSQMQWPTWKAEGQYGCNLWSIVKPITPTANDEDGDGAVKGVDCDDTPGSGFFKRGFPLADKTMYLPEIEQNGFDDNCRGDGDKKYRRVAMFASSSLQSPMKFWDFWKVSLPMSYSGDKWVSAYYPSNLFPQDRLTIQSAYQPAGLVEYSGGGAGCSDGKCYNAFKSNGTCTTVHTVILEDTSNLQIAANLAQNADGQCRAFFPAAH